MKKIVKGFGTLCVSFMALMILVPWMNDLTALLLQRTLEQTPLPEGTVLCDAVSAAGKLEGNGNGMQYFAAILLQSSFSLEELDGYYAKYRTNDWSYLVKQQLGETILTSGRANLSFSFPMHDDLFAFEDAVSQQYYIVYSWGNSDNPFHNLDLRGN